jgi:hypothetical protein
MITQELVLFIKQQLQEGKSKEQIAQLLVPHGWQLEDINGVFTQIMPSAQPVVPPPQMNSGDTQGGNALIQPQTNPSMGASGTASAAGSAITNTQSGSSKKWMIVAGLGVLLVGLGFGGYYAWTQGLIPESITGLVQKNNIGLPLEPIQTLNTLPQNNNMVSPLSEAVVPEGSQDLKSMMPSNEGERDGEKSDSVTGTGTSSSSGTQSVINPEFTHVKDSFPVGFPLPSDAEVITATVLSATNFEGIRYVLNYTSTHSLAYLRNGMKASLEKAGYTVSLNETNQDYRVITASKVVRNTARTFKIIIEKTVLGATVSVVFTQ